MSKENKVLYKVVIGLLGFSAVITEMVTLIERGTFVPTNFFSFFTIESNLLAIASLFIGAFFLYANKKSIAVDYFRGAATVFMAITGIFFSLLLSGLENVTLTAVPWDNVVLHYIMPIAVVLDWFIDRPSRAVNFKKALWWLAFPLLYLFYSLVRGAIVGWYPYPFLNPANGIGSLILVSLGITVVSVGLVYVFCKLFTKNLKAAK